MKPNVIPDILDLAYAARQNNMVFNPSFTGHAGLSKTEQVVSWVNSQKLRNPNFGFVPIRCALFESPDFIGLPNQEIIDGKKVTTHYIPDFWPQDQESEGLIFLDEAFRATTSVMNCLMQLTDSSRGVGPHYKLPKGWIICTANNPEGGDYDVNTPDAGLKDRFENFDIEYDHPSFVSYIKTQNWDEHIINFVQSGAWIFKDPSSIAKGSKYISPRTWSKMNTAHKSGILNNKSLHSDISQAILGKDIGKEFWNYIWNDAPVSAADLLKNKKNALKKLVQQSDPDTYRGDYISTTCTSIVENYGGKEAKKTQISEALMIEVAMIIPKDLAVNLLKEIGLKFHQGKIKEFLPDLQLRYPALIELMKNNIKINKAT